MNNNLMQRRLEKGWTRKQLEEISGVSHTVIKALEYDVRSTNSAQIDTLAKLCSALECRISDVLTEQTLIEKVRECEEN